MSHPLAGKIAIVTGASAGIGWATAEALAAAGVNVVLSARRKTRLDELAKVIEALGSKALVVAADASRTADLDALVDKTIEWSHALGRKGSVDIVLANAGRGLAGGLLSSDRAKWESMYQLNVLGVAHLLRRAAELMVHQKSGDILTLGSVAGANISPFSGFYGSSKWAVWSMTEALRREICSKGVRVTCIMPAIVVSEFQENAGYTHANFGKSAQRFGKLLEPADVARAITFVVSQPPNVHINELVIRPTGQDYP